MMTRRFRKFVSATLVVSFLLFSQTAFSLETQLNVIGDVVADGKAEMKAAFNKWIPIKGKSYPIADGTQLKTSDGKLSVVLRDGVRIEIAKNSLVTISGSRSSYSINLDNGSLGFSVPHGVDFSVVTRTSTVTVPSAEGLIKKVSMEATENTTGVVIYDGKGTKVMSVSGRLLVKSALGEKSQVVDAGKAFYVAGSDAGYRVTPVQLVETTEAAPVYALSPVPFILGGVVVGSYFLINSLYKASPSRFD